MNEFLANIGNFIAQVHWSTWVAVVVLIGFGIRGLKHGTIKELVGLGLLMLSLVIAWLFYNALSTHELITWLSLSVQSNMAIAFGVIFVTVEMMKMGLYKMIAVASTIGNPCTLNKSVLIGLLLIVTAVFNHYNGLIGFNIVTPLLTSEFLRSSLSFMVLFFTFIGLFVTLSKPFNLSINRSSPCFLGTFIQTILNALAALNNSLNSNVIGKHNALFGAIIGLTKGFIYIIVLILILQSVEVISPEYFWADAQSSPQVFQEVAYSVKPELSQHLLLETFA